MERLLTVEAVLRARPRLAPALRAAGCEVRAVAQWDGLLDALERECIAAILVDLDAANRDGPGTGQDASGAPGNAGMLSGDRLVSLLARRARDKRIALVIQTALDFAEIEELIHQGVHALIHPRLKDAAVVACIKRAMEQGSSASQSTREPATPGADEAHEGARGWVGAGWPTPDGTTLPPAFR